MNELDLDYFHDGISRALECVWNLAGEAIKNQRFIEGIGPKSKCSEETREKRLGYLDSLTFRVFRVLEELYPIRDWFISDGIEPRYRDDHWFFSRYPIVSGGINSGIPLDRPYDGSSADDGGRVNSIFLTVDLYGFELSTRFRECISHMASASPGLATVGHITKSSYHHAAIYYALDIIDMVLSLPFASAEHNRSLRADTRPLRLYRQIIRSMDTEDGQLARVAAYQIRTCLLHSARNLPRVVASHPGMVIDSAGFSQIQQQLERESVVAFRPITQSGPNGRRFESDLGAAAGSSDFPTVPPVILGEPSDPVTVLGQEKPRLTRARYIVIKALRDAFPGRLKLDLLRRKCNAATPNQTLRDITKIDSDWESVISFPKASESYGEGYGLVYPSKSP